MHAYAGPSCASHRRCMAPASTSVLVSRERARREVAVVSRWQGRGWPAGRLAGKIPPAADAAMRCDAAIGTYTVLHEVFPLERCFFGEAQRHARGRARRPESPGRSARRGRSRRSEGRAASPPPAAFLSVNEGRTPIQLGYEFVPRSLTYLSVSEGQTPIQVG